MRVKTKVSLLKIKKATPKDLPILNVFQSEIDREHLKYIPAFLKGGTPAYPTNYFFNKGTLIYILSENSEQIGYIRLLIKGEIAIVDPILLLKRYRNYGRGRYFMKEIFSKLERLSVKHVVLNVWSLNTHAFNFYRKLGFKTTKYYLSKKIK